MGPALLSSHEEGPRVKVQGQLYILHDEGKANGVNIGQTSQIKLTTSFTSKQGFKKNKINC